MKQLDLIHEDESDRRSAELAQALIDLMNGVCAARVTIRLGSPLDKAWRKATLVLGRSPRPEEEDRSATKEGP
jgi:hypothetical protein